MTETDIWNVGRLLEWTAQYLGGHGSDSPRLDAEILLAAASGCARIDLYAAFDQVPQEETRVAFRELVRRRAEGTPVAYLVGHREFYSMSFHVTPDVLIPRPETEFLVVSLLDQARTSATPDRPLRIADVGTGSGVVAICAAKHLTECQVTAIDISPKALVVARANAAQHGLCGQIEFVESDLFTAVPADQPFDIIASNPPYVTSAEMKQLARAVAEHEPRLALEAGPRGTEVIERLVPQAARRLAPGGHLLIEISPMIEGAVADLLDDDGRFEPEPVVRDLAGHARVIQARRQA